MTLSLLDHFLLSQLFAFMLIFCRIGAAIMFLPAIGDSNISPRVRLLLALSFSVLLTPFLQSSMPAMPANPIALTLVMGSEITVGVMIGLIVRIMFSAMHVAGTVIATQASLAIASQFDMSNGGQSAVVSNFLILLTTVVFFELNLHLVLMQGLLNSYQLFPAAMFPSTGDMSEFTARAASAAFMMGVQLSAPFLAFGLILYVGGGVMTRLMPQMQVFQILMAPQILLSFFLLLSTLSAMVYLYSDYLGDALMTLFATEGV